MSTTTRRTILSVAAGVIAAGLVAAPATAAPLEQLKILAPAAAGGGWDSTARALQQALTESGLAKSVQVVNVPGAGGTIGLAQFVNEAKGSATQLMVGGYVMVGAILTNKSPVTLAQVTPLARLTGESLVIVVPKNSPHKTAKDLLAAAKADTAKTIWAGGSAGGADHILAALFTQAAGSDPSKVNYVAFSGGGEALAAMLGGRVTAGISGYGEFEGQIKSGDLRALAIASPNRVPGIDVPTLKEQGIDVEVVNWRGIFAGPGLSAGDMATLSKAAEDLVASKQWRDTLKARGWDDFYMPADKFAAFITTENERVGGILKSVGLVK